jgi:hypothetical protein
MSELFEVWLCWYKGAVGYPLHWTIVVCPVGSTIGILYQVEKADTPLTPRWQRGYAEKYDRRTSRTMQGEIFLGYINDPGTFQQIYLNTALPDMATENCQSWIWRVLQEAVRQNVIHSSALANLGRAPVNGY